MFNIDQAIVEWRRQMLAAGVKTPVPLEELEGHLRDDVEQQMRSGLAPRQAFEAAAQRIGQPGALKVEFAKLDGITQVLKRKLVWALIGGAFLSCWFQFAGSPGLALAYGVLLSGLIVATFMDFRRFVIPDQISIGGILVGLLCSMLLPSLHGRELFISGMFQSLFGIGIGAGLLYLVLRAGKLAFGRQGLTLATETMGLGDVKLMAAVGAFLGWQAVIFSLMVSSLLGSALGLGLIAARRQEWSSRLPYGPFIALAATLWIFGGKHLFDAMFVQ